VLKFSFVVALATAVVGATDFTSIRIDPPSTSAGTIVLQRRELPARRPPSSQRRDIDFVTAKNHQKLANGFQAFFKPSKQIDDDADDGFVF
jgi:hypothetical protein